MRWAGVSFIAAVGLVVAAASANAAPVAPVAANAAADHSDIIQVAGGCGIGWHPNRWGYCMPNRHHVRIHRPRTTDYVTEQWDVYDYY